MNDRAAISFDELGSVGLKLDSAEWLTDHDDPGQFIREHTGDVTLFFDDDGSSVKIGRFKAFFIDVEGAARAGISAFDVFDHTALIYDYFELYAPEDVIFSEAVAKATRSEQWRLDRNLLILDRLEILPAYRRQGYGLHALLGLMHWLQPGASIVAMQPFPLQYSTLEPVLGEPDPMEMAAYKGSMPRARAKLRRYYAQLGFAHVPKTDFMVRLVDQPLPRLPLP